MPKKQKGKNAFYYFMLDWKQREEERGKKFANLREVQADPRCSEEWKSLTPQEKKIYETIEKQHKADGLGKKTNVGEPLNLVQMRQREETEFNENMQLYITKTISEGLNNNTLEQTKFYFIHYNWFYIVEDKETRYVPAEYAIGEFSLQNGLERYHHKLVHIKPELGYAWEAINTSNNTHKIPCELPQGEKSFYDMYIDLIQFLEPAKINGKYPPFFAGKKVYKGVSSLFDQLTAAAGVQNTFIVYSMELLFSKLHKAALAQYSIGKNSDPLQSGMLEAAGESEFLKDKFAYASNIECDYHQNLDGTSPYCSLAIIRQWAYTVCDYCCEAFGIKRKPGIHYPERNIDNDIANSMHNMSLTNIRFGTVSFMNGVSEEHRLKVSERSQKEELSRRKESKPLHIIDHTKKDEHKTSASLTTLERPLRPPNTKSFAVAASFGKQDDIPDFCDTNFPSIGGRGVMLKKKPDTKLPNGRGGC